MTGLAPLLALWSYLAGLDPHDATVLAAHVDGLGRPMFWSCAMPEIAPVMVYTRGLTKEWSDRSTPAPMRFCVYSTSNPRCTATSLSKARSPTCRSGEEMHGGAWQASNAGEWQEALGYAVVLTRAGVRGRAPW